MPKVSVVVPIYNVEKYIKKCMDSLVNQTLQEIQIIFVNDGSTDESGNIAKEYASKYPNKIIYLEKENGGFKISMRSKDNVNVSDICLLLGGGGHPRAAGCFITGDVSQAKTKVINTIKQQINK